ncbi:MAG: hypothetical protein IJ219_06570 [Bacteroidaceae bacterium]|nr:hypothetical protein [Bacteroidaceae bacterium]MBQ9169972.1 hypothetical protein [Bacteroidaceae bacterium]MBQ9294575.1 hypothetical protein [Bacteroidaceae bacterium]
MQAISIDNALYAQAKAYASANNTTVEQWVASLIARFIPQRKKHYKMKTMHELSPELLQYAGFAKPSAAEDDMNGEKARDEYLTSRY